MRFHHAATSASSRRRRAHRPLLFAPRNVPLVALLATARRMAEDRVPRCASAVRTLNQAMMHAFRAAAVCVALTVHSVTLCLGIPPLSVPAPLFIMSPRVIAPSVSPLPSSRIVCSRFRYDDWLMERPLQWLVLARLSSGRSLSLPHLFRLDTDVVNLLLMGLSIGGLLGYHVIGSSHLTDTVQEW